MHWLARGRAAHCGFCRPACLPGRRCCRSCSAIRTTCRCPRGYDLFISVLLMCGAVGAAVGIYDIFQQRTTHERHPVAELVLHQPVVWGLGHRRQFLRPALSRCNPKRTVEAILRRASDRNHRVERCSSWAFRRLRLAVFRCRRPVRFAPQHSAQPYHRPAATQSPTATVY